MANIPTGQFEIPAEMRAFAEKSVDQARQAFESCLTAAQRSVTTLEGQAETARQGAKAMGTQTMDFASRNVASSFEFAQQLVKAKDLQEVMELQAAYIRFQMQALAEQAKELGQGAAKMAADSAKASPQS